MVMNMQALISTIEPVQTGYRVAQVEPDANVFAVAEAMFWAPCADDVVADKFWYDPTDNTIKAIPVPILEVQPATQGAQTL
jgi:hypothetical protein